MWGKRNHEVKEYIYGESQINNKVAKQERENTASQSRKTQHQDITVFYGTAETAFSDELVVEDGLVFIDMPDATCSSPRVIRVTCPANNIVESVLVLSFPTWVNRAAWLLLLTMITEGCTGRLASFGV